MTDPQPFIAESYSEDTRRCLFALAYWLAAADDMIGPAEHDWLASQLTP